MAELDLTDPQHLAELLRAALPDFDDQTPEQVGPQVEALRASDNPCFGHIGVGKRVEPDAAAGDEGGAAEQASPRFRALGEDRWTEIERHRSKGEHEIYRLRARHTRSEPITAAFTGECQAVRVRLPRDKPSDEAFIGTWIGTVEARDHLAFSIEEIEQRTSDSFGDSLGSFPPLARVDLITGARFRGRRFSPVSIYLAYPRSPVGPEPASEPLFYLLEGGSASGKPTVMYCAAQLGATIHARSGFRFTPFACADNWYEGGMVMSEDKREPACVYLSVAHRRDDDPGYLRLSVTYDREHDPRRVIHPFELQIEAALRVLALAEQAGCELERGQGGALEHSLGPLANALMPWDERPRGETTAAERDRFCGCPNR